MGTWCCQDYLVGIIISFIRPYQGRVQKQKDPVWEGGWTEWMAGLEGRLKSKRDCMAREGGPGVVDLLFIYVISTNTTVNFDLINRCRSITLFLINPLNEILILSALVFRNVWVS